MTMNNNNNDDEDDDKPTRAETGNIRFGDDWNGVFIRGDNAMYYGIQLQCVLADYKHILKQQGKTLGPFDAIHTAEGLVNLLQSSNQFMGNKTQIMKEFEDCFVELESKKKE
jgi:hypothetical protein